MHKIRKPSRLPMEEGKLQLSAMVDVVFLLLIFFIVTLEVQDVIAGLSVSKPGTSSPPTEIRPPEMLKIRVMPDGYYANNTKTSIESLNEALTKIGAYSPNQDVMIVCSENSEHSQLITLLDTCSKAELTNLHLFSQ